jgi:hypothetical protein
MTWFYLSPELQNIAASLVPTNGDYQSGLSGLTGSRGIRWMDAQNAGATTLSGPITCAISPDIWRRGPDHE